MYTQDDGKSTMAKSRMTTVVNTAQNINENSDSEDEMINIPKKLKADTDAKNRLFEQSLRQRTMAGSKSDYLLLNK